AGCERAEDIFGYIGRGVGGDDRVLEGDRTPRVINRDAAACERRIAGDRATDDRRLSSAERREVQAAAGTIRMVAGDRRTGQVDRSRRVVVDAAAVAVLTGIVGEGAADHIDDACVVVDAAAD